MPRRSVVTVVLLALAACSKRPEAPPLTSEAAYQNDDIGLRFIAPAGWPMQSRAVPPSGALARPVVLVTYQQLGGERPAEFKLVTADLPVDADLERFLTEYRVGTEKWTPHPPVQPITVNGASATRYLLSRSQGKEEVRREVTAFRRGARVYFFLVAFSASDAASRDAVRTSIASVTWTK